jgi:hypothetical protein
MKIKSLGVRRNVLVLAVATTALVVSGGVAVARGGDNAGRDKAAFAAPASVKTSGGVCKAGFATSDEVLKPPDDTAEDNTAAGTVVLTKKCSGAASITFSSETLTTGAGDFINLAFRATCTGSGGYKHHCKVGNTKTASPGETYFQHNVFPQLQVQSVTEVFSGLRRGKWKFEVLPGGNNHAILVFRTTMVQAYSGG